MIHRQYNLARANPLEQTYPRGERLLMLATLEDGIRTILDARNRHVPRKRLREDLDWLTSDDPRPPFSFLSLCDFLGIDPHYLRARVLAACPPEHRERASAY
jgi:hypothetical protein